MLSLAVLLLSLLTDYFVTIGVPSGAAGKSKQYTVAPGFSKCFGGLKSETTMSACDNRNTISKQKLESAMPGYGMRDNICSLFNDEDPTKLTLYGLSIRHRTHCFLQGLRTFACHIALGIFSSLLGLTLIPFPTSSCLVLLIRVIRDDQTNADTRPSFNLTSFKFFRYRRLSSMI